MATRTHPEPGEPFCRPCHGGDDGDCTAEHTEYLKAHCAAISDEVLARKLMKIFTEQANKTGGALITEPVVRLSQSYVALEVFEQIVWDNCDDNTGDTVMTIATEVPYVARRVQDMIDALTPMTDLHALQERVGLE